MSMRFSNTVSDNASLAAKIKLRLHFLERYHQENPPLVFDACQGEGTLWKIIRERFSVASYLGVDKKEKKGRLKLDSSRLLQCPGWQFDVIDVDVYGQPWAHWEAIIERMTAPVTVFVTMGRLPVREISLNERRAAGLAWRIGPGFAERLAPHLEMTMLSRCFNFGRKVIEAAEVPRTKNARYIGIRLE